MDFYTINNLKQDITQTAISNGVKITLYNFFDATFQYLTNIILYQYTVTQFREMRIDLISQDIYQDTKYCDFLLNLNDIDNPLNVKENDTILYVNQEQISYFNLDESTAKTLRNTYLNINKVAKQDTNRSSYVQNNYSLPPTFLSTPGSSVNITSDGKITLGGNS